MNFKKNTKKLFSIGLALMMLINILQITKLTSYAAVGPDLMITEIMQSSQGNDDLYDYIEVYNNSPNYIDMKNYKFVNPVVEFSDSKLVAPYGSLVICFRNTSLQSFNAFYGTALTEDKYLNMNFGSDLLSNLIQTIILTKLDGTIVVSAQNEQGSSYVKRSSTYKYPLSGFEMLKLGINQNPTPGIVAQEQVPSTNASVTGVTIDKPTVSLEVNHTIQLIATVLPASASNKNVTWASNNQNVAMVYSNGVVEAKGEGTAVITVSTVEGGYTATSVVTVGRIPVTGILLDKNNVVLDTGMSFTLNPTFIPANATNKTVTWLSNNNSVAEVNSSGVVTAKGAGATTIIARANDGGFTAVCQVNVNNVPATGVSLDRSNANIEIGKSIKLNVRIYPSNASNNNVLWESSNAAVATVSSSGIVTGISNGTAVITVRAAQGGYSASCYVTVTNNYTGKVTSVRLNKQIISIDAGKKERLNALVKPGNAYNKNVIWKSSNEKIAPVDQNGVVYGAKGGIAIITVTTVDGNYTDKAVVTVIEKKKEKKDHWYDNDKDNGKYNGKGHKK